MALPAVVSRLIDEFARLPGIGRRSAERLAFYVLKCDEKEALGLAEAIVDVKRRVRHCSVCRTLTDADPCPICADPRRDASQVLVVEQPKDLITLESTGLYRGVYHVLLGRLDPLDGVGPESLTAAALLGRLDDPAKNARGAKVTDIAILVVAADDGVMPQTIESITHAKAAEVPIVVALNKIDLPQSTEKNVTRILGQLAEHGLNPVEWGGDVEVIRTSAVRGDGIQDLLDMLDYKAELLGLSADWGGNARGTVLEAQMEEGRGPVARVIVQEGLLEKGDFVVCGRGFGRVRDIVNDRGERIPQAGPSTPVAISGIDALPDAGDKFFIVDSLKAA